MKSNYDGFRGWLNYIRDYKDNKDNDLISEQRLIDEKKDREKTEKKLNKRIKELEKNTKEKDHLLALRNQRIDVLTTKYTEYAKRVEQLRRNLSTTMKEDEKLKEKLRITEKARRKNAGAIGGLKAKINELKQNLERANQKITWLKTNQKAPTKEEIIAYETRQREVEKRQKNGKSNNNI